jgi:hypothetical protein
MEKIWEKLGLCERRENGEMEVKGRPTEAVQWQC